MNHVVFQFELNVRESTIIRGIFNYFSDAELNFLSLKLLMNTFSDSLHVQSQTKYNCYNNNNNSNNYYYNNNKEYRV